MTSTHCTRLLFGVGLLAVWTIAPLAQSPTAASDAPQTYTVFLQSRPIGQETATLVQQPDGWLLKGTNRLGPPLDVVTRSAEIHYTAAWQPTRMTLDMIVRGEEVSVKTAFANGEAANEVLQAGSATPSTKTDKVAADTIVLPNAFLTSYLVLARRIVGQKPGTQFTATSRRRAKSACGSMPRRRSASRRRSRYRRPRAIPHGLPILRRRPTSS